jgi:hypothetical protein
MPASAPASAVVAGRPAERRPPPWERCLAGVVRSGGPEEVFEPAEVGLQFELLDGSPSPARRPSGQPGVRIGLRPVLPGRNGGWVRTGISWSNLGYAGYSRSASFGRHKRLLEQILRLAGDGYGGYAYHYPQTLLLESIGSRWVWDVLGEAREAGLPLVQAGKRATPVTLLPDPAEVCLRVRRDSAGLELEPRVVAGGVAVVAASSLLVGEPAHGIAWWQTPDEPEPLPRDRLLRLARLAEPVSAEVRRPACRRVGAGARPG